MANLYELMGQHAELQRLIEGGEATNERVDEFLEWLDESKGSLRDKVDNICRLLKNLGGDVDGIKKEEKRLKARRGARENNIKKLREWMEESMKLLEVPEIKTDVFTASLVANPVKPVVIDESKVPEEYITEVVTKTRKVDLDKVLKAYQEDGEIVAGCEILHSKHLRIT